MMAGSTASGLSDALARGYEVGPIIGSNGQPGASVPWRERTASGGSQSTVLSSTYYPMVFQVDFALEKSYTALVTRRGKLGVTIRAKDGANYVINTMPAQTTADALAQMGVPVTG